MSSQSKRGRSNRRQKLNKQRRDENRGVLHLSEHYQRGVSSFGSSQEMNILLHLSL